jgi:biotin synthase
VNRDEILTWLREEDPEKLQGLWTLADTARQQGVGDAVHLRGLIELSSHCVRSCAYCGLRCGRKPLSRYRMSPDEVVDCARQGIRLGYGTVVLQTGEDPGLRAPDVAEIVRRIKALPTESGVPLAVTLSLGERADDELALWKQAGANRYLLRFETSDPLLFARIHPSLPGRPSDRVAMLRRLRTLGYEIGSGVMVGIPGQAWGTLADDLLLFRELDLDMIGIGPYLPHPDTPLGRGDPGFGPLEPGQQVPSTAQMTCKAVAIARILCPQANIPSTTALATLDPDHGREDGLSRGANVVMPNLTPVRYREKYDIYPDKACLHETAETCAGCLRGRIEQLGRVVGSGQGGRMGTEACSSVAQIAVSG